MRIGVVFNPRSGARQGRRLYRMTKAAIVGSGHEPIFMTVERHQRIEHAIIDRASDVDVIATIGGDGTLNGVVNGILRSSRPDLPVAFFPAGRGRDMARSLPSFSLQNMGKHSIDWQEARKVDVVNARQDNGDQRYFINVADVGLSGEAARIASMLPRQLGSASYMIGAVKAFLTSRSASVRISLDGREVMLDDVLLLAICNGRSFGGGLYIAPEAEPDDGFLDLVAVRNANLVDLGRNLPKLRQGLPFEHQALSRWRAKTISVAQCDLAPIDLDGDIWGAVPITFSAVPSALNWIGTSR